MGYYVKAEAPCIECATPTTKRQSGSRAPLCFDCGIKHACANIRFEVDRKAKRIRREIKVAKRQSAG